jgi:hypothetical protein
VTRPGGLTVPVDLPDATEPETGGEAGDDPSTEQPGIGLPGGA